MFRKEKSKRKGFFLLFLFFASLISLPAPVANTAAADHKPQIVYFYQETCQECKATAPFVKVIEDKYKDKVIFEKLEVTQSQEARNAYFAFAAKYNLDTANIGVPLLFIGEKSLIGKEQIISSLENEIELQLKNPSRLKISVDEAKRLSSLSQGTISCADQTACKPSDISIPALSLPLIIGAAAVDSINPCAIAVLIILISFLLGIEASRKRLLAIGLIYIGAVYLAYLLAGLGILKFIQVLPLQVEWIQIFAAFLLLIFAFLNFSDAYSAVSGSSKSTLAIPQWTKPIIQKYLTRATLFAALLAGIIVAFVELPCTGAVYFGILSLLANSVTYFTGLSYLLLYNLIFVSPLLLILFAASFGKDVRIFEQFSKQNKALVKVLMGMIITILAVALLWPIRNFIDIKFQNLAQFAAGKEIPSLAILLGTITSITVSYFFFAVVKPQIKQKINIFFCAICYAISLTWLMLFVLLALGFRFDMKILAALMGMSLIGIMYQLDSYFKEKQKKMFWLLRIILIDAGILTIYGVVFASLTVFLAGLIGFLLLIFLFFYFAGQKPVGSKTEKSVPSSGKNKALKELEQRLENCC